MKTTKKGFTLIELLVVIAIVALLASVVTYFVNSARLKGRDAKRLSDMKEMQKALELYFSDCNGYPGGLYSDPDTGDSGRIGNGYYTLGNNPVSGTYVYGDQVVATKCTTKMSQYLAVTFPTDPLRTGKYVYQYCSANNAGNCAQVSGTGTAPKYKVRFNLETQNGDRAPGTYYLTPNGIVRAADAEQCDAVPAPTPACPS